MDCVELQQSLAEVEDVSSSEQRAHLKACPACSALVSELKLIMAAAPQLQEADEPSPRVWNSIEIALRQEGLIRPQRAPVSSFSARWGAARSSARGAAGGHPGYRLAQNGRPAQLTGCDARNIQVSTTVSGLSDRLSMP